MSIVTIVLVSIDIAKESDLLLKLMDIMMLCSAVIQLVAIVAGVVVGLLVGVQVTGGKYTFTSQPSVRLTLFLQLLLLAWLP